MDFALFNYTLCGLCGIAIHFFLTWDDNSPSCWEAGVAPLQTFMCRTCLSSLARALSLSLNRLSASRSLSSSSCSRLCCLCKRASSPMVDPTLASRFPPSLQRGRHTPPAAGTMVSCSSSSRMESCLMTAPCKDMRENPEDFYKHTKLFNSGGNGKKSNSKDSICLCAKTF